jgi:hypothetical protein
MQTPIVADNIYETSANVQSRMNQLEKTILELYQSFGSIYATYGTLDFAQVPSAYFDTPCSTHFVPIPSTKLNVTLITTPPHVVISSLNSLTPGPLRWTHEITIEFPLHTRFVSLGYGGIPGDVQWFVSDASSHPVRALYTLIVPGQTGQFYLVRPEGIHSVQIPSTGKMFLSTLAVGISARTSAL